MSASSAPPAGSDDAVRLPLAAIDQTTAIAVAAAATSSASVAREARTERAIVLVGRPGHRGSLRRGGEAELLDPIADLVAIQPEHRAGFGLIAAAAPQRLDQQAALELLQIDTGRGQLELVPGADRRGQRGEIAGIEAIAIGQEHGALDHVAQLAHVAGPAVSLQQRIRRRSRAEHVFPELRIEGVDEVL